MFADCTYLGITGEYGLLYCSDDITSEYVGSVNECVYVDDGDDDDSGGSPGEYNPDEGSNETMARIMDVSNLATPLLEALQEVFEFVKNNCVGGYVVS